MILSFKFIYFIFLSWFLTLRITCRLRFCLLCCFKSILFFLLNAFFQNIWSLINLKFLLVVFILGGKHHWTNSSTDVFACWPVIFGLQNFLIAFKNPFCITIYIFLINYSKYVNQLILERRCFFIVLIPYSFLIVIWSFYFIYKAVVNCLIRFLVW